MNEDGSIAIGVDLDISKADKELAKLKEQILKTEKDISDTTAKRQEALKESSSLQVQLDAENKKLAQMKAQLKELQALAKDRSAAASEREWAKTQIPDMREQIQEQTRYVNNLTKEFNRVENSIDRYDQRLKDAGQKLDEQTQRAGDLTQALEETGGQGEYSAQQISLGFEKVGKRLTGLAKRVFVFSLFTTALRSLRDWMGKAIKTNAEASEALARLKGSLLALAQPILNYVIPAFTAFVNVLTKAIQLIGSAVSKIFGSSYDASAKAAQGLYEEQQALSGVGAAAKEAGKSLASFDEINQLSGDNAAAGGGAGGGGAAAPDFTGMVTDSLDSVIGILTGLALMAIGAILVFSGASIPVGLALIVAGALMYYGAITADWTTAQKLLQGPLGALLAILSAFLLVIGAILVFSGANIPLGIALMVIGAVGLATVVAANWDKIVEYLRGPLGVLLGILSAALLVIGAILVFSGANLALGLGLMIAGAMGLAATITANWDTIKTLLQGPIGAITVLLSSALLVIGGILTFSGAHVGLGLGLMLLGAAGLATTIAANWESVQILMQGPIGAITAMLSTALLVLGGVLLFTGANIPLGLGLIAVGAVGLGTTIAANWDTLVTIFGDKTHAIQAIIGGALLVLGAILCFSGVAVPLGIGLLAAGGATLASAAAPNWDFIQEKLQEGWSRITSWFNANVAKWLKWDTWKEIGKNMLDGLFGGWGGGDKAAATQADSIVKSINKSFGVNSPSTEMISTGKYLMVGLNNGISQNSPQVVTTFNNLLYQLTSASSTATEQIQGHFQAFLTWFTSVFAKQWSSTWTTAQKESIRSMQMTEQEIARLNASLASIERDVTITITTIYVTKGDPNDFREAGGMDRTRTVSALGGTPIVPVPAEGGSGGIALLAAPAISTSQIPDIAKGLAIPQNREFTNAVYNSSTTNSESGQLVNMIIQAIKDGFSQIKPSDDGQNEAAFYVGEEQFGRLVYRANKRETRRIGASLVEE